MLDEYTQQAEGSEPLLSTEEAAALAGCSARHLENLRTYGTGPAFLRLKSPRGKRTIFYRPEDVTVWIAQRGEVIGSEDAPEGLLSTEQAAAALDLSPGTLATYRSTGRGPDFVHVQTKGRGKPTAFYRPEDLVAWKEARS